MKKVYEIEFKRTMTARTWVEADTPEQANQRFSSGEWIDAYETIEILKQHVIEVKEKGLMLKTDKEWKSLVRNIANRSVNRREYVLEAVDYLWDSCNWERLHETAYGKFLREVHDECPDLLLRSVYRKQVLESKE